MAVRYRLLPMDTVQSTHNSIAQMHMPSFDFGRIRELSTEGIMIMHIGWKTIYEIESGTN